MKNVDKLKCDQIIKDFTWEMLGKIFKTDVLVLLVGGYDIILEVDWMKHVSPVVFDFESSCIIIRWEQYTIELKQSRSQKAVKLVLDAEKGNTIDKGDTCFLIQVRSVRNDKELGTILDEVTGLTEEYQDVFDEPKGLPPQLSHDHKIPLKLDSIPVNANPYKCPYIHKTEIEKVVKEMLTSGIVRHSSSPYASSVLLVRKKDNSWHLCVDYRALNFMPVKNKFPIPVIEELLAELKGSCIYSKLDLRSEYHQIRVHEDNIPKTALRTHQGHYEFLVMPFGLTNAPATFQSLMNLVFSKHLRYFVLVFFDDILVYSLSMELHKKHLTTMLDLKEKCPVCIAVRM